MNIHLKPATIDELTQGELQVPPNRSDALLGSAANFNERLMAFNLIEQMNHLCRGVQRHRGLSIGLLAGDQAFANSFQNLRQQMSRRIELVVAFSQLAQTLAETADIEKLCNDWGTIRDNWLDDSVLENFEFHSHFVSQLLLLISRLAEQIQRPYLHELQASVNEDVPRSSSVPSIYEELLSFSTRQLPQFIEMLGKVRALSVHMTATGYSEEDYAKKVSYLLQCIAQEATPIFQTTAHFQQVLGDQLPSMVTVKIHEYKLNFLIEKVDKEIVSQTKINIKGEEIFCLASDVIDAYWSAVDDSLSLLQVWHSRDIERWLLEG